MTDGYTVLVVGAEDVSRYVRWLSLEYDVETASDSDALEDVEDVDVVVLDSPPAASGGRIASELERRASTRERTVVAVVECDTGLVHLHCSEALDEPVTESTVLDTVTRLRRRAEYDDRLAEFADLAAERGRLEAERPASDLEDDPAYESLCGRLEDLGDRLEGMAGEFDATDYRAMFETPDFAGGSRVQRVSWPS